MADYASVLTGGTNSYATTSEDINALATDILSQGVVGTIGNTSGVAPATGALAVNAQGTPDMTVAVTAGKAWVTVTPTSQGSQKLRANIAAQNATIAANSTGGTRYDWIYVAMSASGAANPAVDGTGVASITVSRSTSISTDNGTPPTYGYNIAKVTVANGATSITNGNIADMRSAITVASNSAADGWTTAEATPATVTGLGNRSYSLVFSSVDMTDTISPGMRLKLTRTTAAPTKCTDLESGSSNYYSKTSPNKMTFTDDFVCSAWIKLESYTGSVQVIASRYNGTSGYSFSLDASGCVTLTGFNGGSSNFSNVVSVQSVPLGRWVHVAAQLDMSAFTATTTTSYVMFDGVDVPSAVNRGGTNPTALVQAGNLEIGGRNGGLQPFDGKLAQVAIYSAKVTQATILASIDRTLTGSETSLASAYSFNNSIADLNTTTPNDLTAQNSAVATNADSPFAQDYAGVPGGTTEYAIVTKTAFSTNTTLTVQCPEGGAIPSTGGVSAMSYSTHRLPYGFPGQKSRWTVMYENKVLSEKVSPSASTWYNALYNTAAVSTTIPIGQWKLGYTEKIYGYKAATTSVLMKTTLSTANNTESNDRLTAGAAVDGASATFGVGHPVSISDGVELSTATTYYLNVYTTVASMATLGLDNGFQPLIIFAECDYV